MFKITLQAKEKENYVEVETYDISYPFNQIKQNQVDKQVDLYLENVEHNNIKGNYYIYYSKKIDLNDEIFLSGTSKVQTDTGWLTNTSQLNKNGYQTFNPIVTLSANYNDFSRSKDILGVKQYVIFQKHFFQYINLTSLQNANFLQSSGKNKLPLYLIRTLDEINNNFQFFMEYEDYTNNGYFTDEKVTLYFRLSEENIV